MREKDRGIWKAYTWRDYGANAPRHRHGADRRSGCEPGDCVAILSDNNKEWLFCDLGVLCAAGISTGIYPTDSPAQVEYLINDCKAKFLFVEDEEQLDKILAVRERTPHLQKIIVFDMEGLREFYDPQVMPLSELSALGESLRARPSRRNGKSASPSRKPDDVAIIVYTSGTTGPSKGALLTHRNIIFQIGAFKRIGLAIQRDRRGAQFPAAVPRRRAVRRLLQSHRRHARRQFRRGARHRAAEPARGGAAHLPRRAARVGEALFRRHHRSSRKARRSAALAYKAAIGIGCKASAYELEGKPVPALLRAARAVGDWLVLKNIRVMHGPQPHPLGGDRRGPDLARPDRLVLGAGRPACTRSMARPRTPGSPPRTIPATSRSAPSA